MKAFYGVQQNKKDRTIKEWIQDLSDEERIKYNIPKNKPTTKRN